MKRVTLCVTLGKNIDENNPKMITVAYWNNSRQIQFESLF